MLSHCFAIIARDAHIRRTTVPWGSLKGRRGMQVWCTAGTRTASETLTGQQQCRLTPTSPSTMCCLMKVSVAALEPVTA